MDYKNLSKIADSAKVQDSSLGINEFVELLDKALKENDAIYFNDGLDYIHLDEVAFNDRDERMPLYVVSLGEDFQYFGDINKACTSLPWGKVIEENKEIFGNPKVGDSVNRTTLVEEVLDADFQVIKREIDEKGSCFKTAEKIASLIGSTKGGVKDFAEELKNSDIKGISYKKGEKDDYKGIRGTIVYGAEDSSKVEDSEEKPEFNDVRECIDWWDSNADVSEDSADITYWDESGVDEVFIGQDGKEHTEREIGIYKTEEDARAGLEEDMKKFGFSLEDWDEDEGVYRAFFTRAE